MEEIDKRVANGGQFAENLVHFARLLRSAGLPIGTGRVLDAVRAVSTVGLSDREDFYWTLHAVFVNHPTQRLIFDQAFHVFWKNPKILERSMAMLLPKVRVPEVPGQTKEMAKRLSDSLYLNHLAKDFKALEETETEIQASLTYSDRERLQTADFESMSRKEVEQARKVISDMKFDLKKIATRRFRTHRHGERLDMRSTLKRSMRGTADTISLVNMKRKFRSPGIIVLCDISGSMCEYARMLLHFSHALMSSRNDISSFVFGTRLTNITRQLKTKDVDCALNQVSDAVEDWYGGTRIGECLEKFNRYWVRRLPVHSSIVLLVSDGLDRSESGNLPSQIQLLHRSCRHLIWLNPLLRYKEFEPRVEGIRAMLPHVDEFRPVHNLDSLESLAKALADGPQLDDYSPSKWKIPELSGMRKFGHASVGF